MLAGRDSSTAAESSLSRRLVNGGLAHPVVAERAHQPGEVAGVVPVRDDPDRLQRLLEGPALDGLRIVVVDDGSKEPLRVAELAARAGAELVRHDMPHGPAAARNSALPLIGALSPRLVALLDADSSPSQGWLGRLIPHFDDASVGAVAPRVRAVDGRRRSSAAAQHIGGGVARLIADYESVRSPLDLGPLPAGVGAHRRVSYVPTAALVCRLEALDDVGWFDDGLAVGEDVDLERRLEVAGWSVRYEPASVVHHDARATLAAFAGQRFAYGTSAAALERKHPGTVPPFESRSWSVAGAAAAAGIVRAARRPRRGRAARAGGTLAACGWLVSSAPPAVSIARMLAGKDQEQQGKDEREVVAGTYLRLGAVTVLKGQLWAAAGTLTAVRRVWWPVAVLVAAVFRRRRRLVAGLLGLATAAGIATDFAETPPRLRGLGSVVGLSLLDDACYGAGVWAGCLEERSARALLPRVRSSPAPRSNTLEASGEGPRRANP